MRTVLRWLLRLLYRFRAFGEEGLRTPGPVLLLPNHVSWWDWLFIGVCLENDWRFVTSSATAELSWLHRRIMVNRRTFPVDMNSPFALKRIAEYLQRGGRLVLFPEGRLSRTGSLMKLFDGTGFLIAKTRPKVITAFIRGAQRLPFSPNAERKRWFPPVSVHFSPVLALPTFQSARATEIRARLTEWLRAQMLGQQFEAEMRLGPPTVPAALVDTARQWPGRIALQDATLQEVTYRRLLVGAALLARQWQQLLAPGQARVGVLLPNVNALPVTLFSLWAANRIPAILNYSMGSATLVFSARLAGLKQIVTSKTFIERAKLDLEPLKREGIEMVLLEEVRAQISFGRRLMTLLGSFFASPLVFGRETPAPADLAVVLFTSGSEGDPKGVELTHANLLANIRQMLSVIDVQDTDRFLNALPLFHSFGLTVGTLLPLIRGAFTLLYLSPLHYRVVPSAFYNLDCTVFFGTNTFLLGYARKANPYDFRSLRYVFAGAEKVQESTRALWMDKFGIRILEGYGATECSPCLTVNLPLANQRGSVGRFLPAIEGRTEPVEGVSSEQPGSCGRLFVRGPNIMRGYLNPEANGRFAAAGGWYDTGDIVRIDPRGFVFIEGRLKRFAKVSGEMVSLAAVEEALSGAFPEYGQRFAVAVIAKSDRDKGERLIAVTNEPRLETTQVRAILRARGFSNLAMPREVKCLRELPHLGTGKIDLRALEKIV